MKHVFQEVAITATKRWVDASGKRRQQTKKFFQTINPYNKGKDGMPKTREQILTEIAADRAAWMEPRDE
jgi:hypothetical protein